MFYNYNELNLEGEIWKDVVGWEEFYQVSNLGRIKAKERVMYYDRNLGRGIEKKKVKEKIRKPKLNKHTGYLMVGLNCKGKAVNVTVHSMVAKAFIENYKAEGKGKGKCTNHKDGNKLNNCVENLEVIPIADNVRHMFNNGLTTSNHRVKYENVIYISKTDMRIKLKISEREQRKMIESGEIIVLNK